MNATEPTPGPPAVDADHRHPAGIPPLPSLTGLATVGLVVVADLGSKAAVAHTVAPGYGTGPLQPTLNPEFSLGIASADRTVMVAVMVAGILAALIFAGRLLAQQRISSVAAGLTIGGAVGNTVDRLLHGAVQDFLVTGPVVINLADLAVLVGLALSAYGFLRTRSAGDGRHRLSARAIERHRRHPKWTRSTCGW